MPSGARVARSAVKQGGRTGEVLAARGPPVRTFLIENLGAVPSIHSGLKFTQGASM